MVHPNVTIVVEDDDKLSFLSLILEDVSDLWLILLAILMIIGTWIFASYLSKGLFWMVGLYYENTLRKLKRRKQRHGPISRNRLLGTELFTKWLMFFIGSGIVFIYFELHVFLLFNVTTTALFFIGALISRTVWLLSWIARFYVLWYDYVRIGDVGIYKNSTIGTITAMHTLTFVLTVTNNQIHSTLNTVEKEGLRIANVTNCNIVLFYHDVLNASLFRTLH